MKGMRYWILPALALAPLIIYGGLKLAQERKNACRVLVAIEMDTIRQAALKYLDSHERVPDDIQVLVPEFLTSNSVQRATCRGLFGNTLVPQQVYVLRKSTNKFDVVCIFRGGSYSNVVMNSLGAVNVE